MEPAAPRRAWVAGATGAVGSFLVRELLDAPLYSKVTSVSRSPLGFSHPKLESHVLPFNELDRQPGLFEAGDVFCCLGLIMKKAGSREAFHEVDYVYPLRIAELARASGATRYFLVSSVGASKFSPFYYLRVKGEAEESLASAGFESLHLFRPSLIEARRKEFRLNEASAILFFRAFGACFSGRLSRYLPVKAEVIARAMRKVAEGRGTGRFVYESEDIRRIGQCP